MGRINRVSLAETTEESQRATKTKQLFVRQVRGLIIVFTSLQNSLGFINVIFVKLRRRS